MAVPLTRLFWVDALSSQTETKPIQSHFFSMPSSHNKLFARIREHKNNLRTAKLNLITICERSVKKKSFHAINRFADQFFAISAAHASEFVGLELSTKLFRWTIKLRVDETSWTEQRAQKGAEVCCKLISDSNRVTHRVWSLKAQNIDLTTCSCWLNYFVKRSRWEWPRSS